MSKSKKFGLFGWSKVKFKNDYQYGQFSSSVLRNHIKIQN